MFKKVGMGIVTATTVLIVGFGLNNVASTDFGLNGVIFGNFDTKGDKVDVYKFKAETTNLAYFSLGIKNRTKNDYNLY
ncbi:hypothetical protein [Bacillus thuringiensis]|uniref:hypothetical protein n=1 Tax=Bacillus thuringiensis TaxID=1428 RepID=UPI002155562F|nr:hypothetical protein [Bacillus thuringiensis]